MLTIGITQSLHEHTNQKAIEMTNEMGGFVVLAHPNWGRQGYWPLNELLSLKGYIGIEVINQLIYRLSDQALPQTLGISFFQEESSFMVLEMTICMHLMLAEALI